MDVRFLVLSFLLILGGCLPEAKVSKGLVASQSGNTPTTVDPTIPNIPTQWNYLAGNFNSITIYASNLNNAYITGYETEVYLSREENFKNQTYCLVSDYSLAGNKRQLRTQVVPVSYYDFTAKRTVRVFRVDFNVISSGTEDICSQSLYSYNSLGEYELDLTVPATFVNAANKLCPSCTSRLTSTRIRLFKAQSGLYEVPVQSIKLNGLGLIVDPNSGTSGGGGNGSCSIASCQAQGYDCCLEEQCVDNSAVRPSAQTLYPNEYAAAEEERIRDPLAWMRYPQIYYVCPNFVPPTDNTSGGSGGGSTTGPDYQEGLTRLKKDFACLEIIKSQSPSTPFHQDLTNYLEYRGGNSECITEDSDSALQEFMHFKNVAKRLYAHCGCSYSELSDMISYCPAYYYKVASRTAAGEPTSFECTVLTQETIPPFQQIGVSTRSAPHRFYNTDGVEYSSPDQSNRVQEGDEFTYLDDINNNHSQEAFGINSILGPMSLTLDKALPAKQVSVELDQVYLIRTINGFYTPCETCGPDKWHESLTAYPRTNWGIGLQAVGFSTKRDDADGNITGGNYEDTIFGRACWIPPTMLPFTHETLSDSSNSPTRQRRARLKAQAVLYSNGYQRDWFGFNKGALIGSFDGVSWFAVGNGRLVKSTSKKLFLAINAPFADVASPSVHNVQISLYDGYSTAAQVDYDPQYHLSHSLQNQAGNCQANHMCQTDSDCITRLGWEYTCADVSQIKTKWPIYDPNTLREEIKSDIVTIDQILAQKKFPSGDTKRCVYRGAGAVCLSNSNSITDLNQKKVMSCAPNFYCASLSSSTNISSKVSRYATNLDNLIVNNNHLYGQDANVLGRPLNYLGENNVLIPEDSKKAIQSNIAANHSSLASAGAGICRPGKVLPTAADQTILRSPFEQQKNPDGQKRTDFINQIASCNPTLFTNYRQTSCPVLDSNGNYIQFESSSLPTDYHLLAGKQNACGLESLSNNTALNSGISVLHNNSAFYSIEAVPLTQKTVTTRTLVRDACLRRAGAVCHTDLDCSPNKMHAEAASFKSLLYFGNEAEKTYWQENLVCGQMNPKPSIYDTEATKNYDHTLNRCCREIGNNLTTVTTDTPQSTANDQYLTYSQGLITSAHPGTIPSTPKRYSRLATVENLGSTDRPTLSANTSRDNNGDLLNTVNITTGWQWKTLREANSETCCGGGWIRKFSDGSNDWKQNRLQFDVNNFACLNSRHPLLTINESTIPDAISDLYLPQRDMRNLINRDYHEYCQDTTGTEGSCAQNSFRTEQTEAGPISNEFGEIVVDTRVGSFSLYTDYLFKPFSGDANPAVTMVYDSSTAGARKNITIRIPSYIPRIGFDDVYISNPASLNVQLVSENAQISCTKSVADLGISSHTSLGTCAAGCCYNYNSDSRILKVAIAPTANANIRNKESGVRFKVDLSAFNDYVARTTPGNDIYYLNRLARLELSGIPQITYEPIYCNDNAMALMPGMFRPSLMKTATDFNKSTHSFKVDGKWQTTHHALLQPPVFSEDKFKCCMPLGNKTTEQGLCCSGFGIKDEDSNKFTCALPTGTDLMVYLNPFVSNEGISLGLQETDFNKQTGEPELSPTVINKISQIGRDYCQGKKVRQGGAFGNYEPEPQGSRTDVSKRIYQILDSTNDIGQVTNTGATLPSGYNVFNQGFRWNHHLYCTE